MAGLTRSEYAAAQQAQQQRDQMAQQALGNMSQQPKPLPMLMLSAPGITKDGTRFQRQTYIDGEWIRFWQDKPRKMLGYREHVRTIPDIVRAINLFSSSGYIFAHVASIDGIQRYAIEQATGVFTAAIDRTPSGYVANASNLWQMDTIFQSSGTLSQIFAVAPPSLFDITSVTPAQVYYGDPLDTALLQPAVNTGTGGGNITSSGGLCAVGPYLFLYGDDGLIQWSVPGFPLNFSDAGSGAARPVPDKIVRGMPLRGSSAPAAIFWSLSACIVGNFVGGDTFWNFTTVSTSTSILSSSCVVEHNGIYYWVSTTGFQRFSGVMEDIPNEYNQDFFLTNLNFAQRQKVFAVKIPRWNEIWWCCPLFGATECNHAIIYNYEKNYWYDTPLPNGGRAAGTYDDTYSFPLMSGVQKNSDTGGYSIWQHEFGLDEVSGAIPVAKAIRSFYETHEFSLVMPSGINQLGQPFSMSFSTLEPDFSQRGDLTLEIFSRQNPGETRFVSPTDSVYVANGGYPIPDPAAVTNQQNNLVDFKWTGRLTSFIIQSNTLGGDFFAGSPLVWWKPSDQRRTG